MEKALTTQLPAYLEDAGAATVQPPVLIWHGSFIRGPASVDVWEWGYYMPMMVNLHGSRIS